MPRVTRKERAVRIGIDVLIMARGRGWSTGGGLTFEIHGMPET